MSGGGWWTEVLNSDSIVAQSIIKNMMWDHGIKLLALDFDRTIVDINTGGKWKDSPEKLVKHVRPCFRELIGAALKNGGVRVSVVTYSIQPELIAQMFKCLYPKSNTNNIIIEANPKHIRPQLSPMAYRVGKQKHIGNVTKRLYDQYGIVIQPYQVMLFDDRSRYIKLAKDNGHVGYEVKNDITLDDIRRFVEDIPKPDSTNDPKIPPQATTSRNVTVVAIGSWPPKYMENGSDNVEDATKRIAKDDGDGGNGVAIGWNKDHEYHYGMKLGTSIVAVGSD